MQPSETNSHAFIPPVDRSKGYKLWSRYSESIESTNPMPSRAQFWTVAGRLAHYQAQKLAEHSKMNIRQIERRCREELGRAPQEWLNEQKLVAARWLLLENKSVKEVALELGFKQLSHFCREFKHVYGLTPSQYLLLHKRFGAKCR